VTRQETRILYVNVYRVTRHFGGPEEGGWYYNAGEPLASIPFKGMLLSTEESAALRRRQSLPDGVYECPPACHDEEGNCRFIPYPDEPEPETEIECNCYSVLVLYSFKWFQKQIVTLRELFEAEAHGNIYSVLGGAELSVVVSHEMARPFPDETPRYE